MKQKTIKIKDYSGFQEGDIVDQIIGMLRIHEQSQRIDCADYPDCDFKITIKIEKKEA